MLTTLLLLALAGPPAAAQPIALPAAARAKAGSDHDALLEAYEAALETHEARMKAVEDRKERKALRKAHPGYTYFPRFEAVAAKGEGEAYLWLLEHTKYADASSSERRELQARYAVALVEGYVEADWFEDAVRPIVKARRGLGAERLLGLLERIVDESEEDEVRAAAAFAAAGECLREKSDEARQAGFAWYERILADWPDTSYARRAEPELNRARYLVVGGEPMDFEAETVDGQSFKLSDYRGKVVLLDFWGFW